MPHVVTAPEASGATRSEEDTVDDQSPAIGKRHAGGAPLLPPVISYVVLAVAGITVPAVVAGESPYTSDASLLDFYGRHSGAAHLLAFLTLGSAVPYAVLAAIASHRVRIVLDVPGRLIALVGGAVAAGFLALSGLCSLALTQPHVADSPVATRALSGLAFAAGGPGFVVFSGLLVAGISVPSLVGGLAPRWIGYAGLAIALLCEVASLVAATSALTPLLPVGRFASMAWLLALALTLPAQNPKKPRPS